MTENDQATNQSQASASQTSQNAQAAVRTTTPPARRSRPMPPSSDTSTPSSTSPGEKPAQTEISGEGGAESQEGQGPEENVRRVPPVVYQGRFLPAFWTIASIVSLTINVILIAMILILGRQLFNLRTIISEGLVNGLYENFVLMDEAHIVTDINVASTIHVQDQMPVVFDLPLNQDTEVVLTEPTSINGATIFLNGAAVPLNIILPTGTALNIGMDMVVPVSTTIPVVLTVPVNLTVPVDIPLENTDLHEPFVGLQSVVAPYNTILSSAPSSWEQIEGCTHWYSAWFCKFIFGGN
jgi:hypothetical protein